MAARIRALQPQASQRKIAGVLGVGKDTVAHDLGRPRGDKSPPPPATADETGQVSGYMSPPASELSGAEVAKLAQREDEKAHNHRAQGTGEHEWYTPPAYLDLVRAVLLRAGERRR